MSNTEAKHAMMTAALATAMVAAASAQATSAARAAPTSAVGALSGSPPSRVAEPVWHAKYADVKKALTLDLAAAADAVEIAAAWPAGDRRRAQMAKDAAAAIIVGAEGTDRSHATFAAAPLQESSTQGEVLFDSTLSSRTRTFGRSEREGCKLDLRPF